MRDIVQKRKGIDLMVVWRLEAKREEVGNGWYT